MKMQAGGMTYQAIGDKVGLTKARVHMIVKRHEERLEE
jgi:DNA-binding MarR family transcriptional regulator